MNHDHPGTWRGDTGRLTDLAIMLMVTLSVIFVGLAGCSHSATTPSGQTPTTQPASSQTAPIQTSASQPTASSGQVTTTPTTGTWTTTGSQIASPDRFSPADLTVDGILVGSTPHEVEQVLGVPVESRADIDPVSGLDVLTYTYDGAQMIFMEAEEADSALQLKYVEVTGRGYVLTRGIRVGDKASDVLRLFHRDPGQANYEGYMVLYGDPNLLDREVTTHEIAFAYYGEREIYFLYMKPPYMTGQATIYDEMAVLRLTVDDEIITKAFWMLGPGAE